VCRQIIPLCYVWHYIPDRIYYVEEISPLPFFYDDYRARSSTCLPFTLKFPLLLMIATLNSELLILLEKFIGIKIATANFMWSSCAKMVRCNIATNVDFTSQSTRRIKEFIKRTLIGNLDKSV